MSNTTAKKSAQPTTKKALKAIFKQLAPIGLGIFVSELERRLFKEEHLTMIDEHNSLMEEKRNAGQ